ncbi:MAG: hypothetical protein R3246_15190, partial [Acidimicrobiia bacterium]|nr:hypothetical protein [Acidimicrobiia bacterium]
LHDDASASDDPAITGGFFFNLGPFTDVDELDVEWTATFSGVQATLATQYEAVTNHIATIDEIEDHLERHQKMQAGDIPVERIAAARDNIADRFEQITGRSWQGRHTTYTTTGHGGNTLIVPHFDPTKLLAATINGTALTSGELADITIEGDELTRINGSGVWATGERNNITIRYQRGFTRPERGVTRVALLAIANQLVPGPINPRQLSTTNEFGTTRYSTPGSRFPFGIPEVDQWLHEQTLHPAIAR